jgi:hypothetical protein
MKLLLNTVIKMISKELFDYEMYFLCVLKNITEAKNMLFFLIYFEKNITDNESSHQIKLFDTKIDYFNGWN